MSNDGVIALVVKADPGEWEHYEPGTLTMMVVISNGQIAGWSVVSYGEHTFFKGMIESKNPNAYVGQSISNITPLMVSGATASSDAFYNIIKLSAIYASSLYQ